MPVPGVVGAHDDVDEDGAGEDDGRPGGHVAGEVDVMVILVVVEEENL